MSDDKKGIGNRKIQARWTQQMADDLRELHSGPDLEAEMLRQLKEDPEIKPIGIVTEDGAKALGEAADDLMLAGDTIMTTDGRRVTWCMTPLTAENLAGLGKDPKSVKAGEAARKALADKMFPDNPILNMMAQDPDVLAAASAMMEPAGLRCLGCQDVDPLADEEIMSSGLNYMTSEGRLKLSPERTFEHEIELEPESGYGAFQEWMEATMAAAPVSQPPTLRLVNHAGEGSELDTFELVGVRCGEGRLELECKPIRPLEEDAAVVVWKCFGCGESGWAPYSSVDSALQLGLEGMREHNRGCHYQAIILDGFDNADRAAEMANVARWKLLNQVSDE